MTSTPARRGPVLRARHALTWAGALAVVLVLALVTAGTSSGRQLVQESFTRVDPAVTELSTPTTRADLRTCPCMLVVELRNASDEPAEHDLTVTADGSGETTTVWQRRVRLAAGEQVRLDARLDELPEDWEVLRVELADRPEHLSVRREEAG